LEIDFVVNVGSWLFSRHYGNDPCSKAHFRITRHSRATHDVAPTTFDEGHHETSAIGWTQGIAVGSRTFQPLIQSQRVENTSPKAVMRVKSKLAFGRM
jgi:hypothetical protein